MPNGSAAQNFVKKSVLSHGLALVNSHISLQMMIK